MKMKTTALFLALGFTSCATVNSLITKSPIPTTPVQREGGKPFNVATADVLQAEANPDKVWGLYDAKGLADVVRSSSK